MKTLAQQYQDLLNFIDSAHSLKLSDIANICENATMEFCQNLPSEFDYKVSYSEYDESVEIVANVKGQSEKTFSVTKGMIARLNTNDCYFAQCLSSYKEQEEEVYTDLINFFQRLISDYPNLSYVSFYKHFSTKEIQHFYIMISDDIDSMQEGSFFKKIKSPSKYMVDLFNSEFPNFEYISRDSFDIIVKKEQSKQEVKEEQQEVKEQDKEDLYSDILFENDDFNSFIENNCTPILGFEFDSDNNIYIYDEGTIAFEGQIFSESLFRDIIKLGMYIERRNQLNKSKKYILLKKYEDITVKYFGCYINELLSNWVYEKLIKDKNESDCNSLFRQIKDFIVERLRDMDKKNPLQNIDWSSKDADKLIKNIQQDILTVFE